MEIQVGQAVELMAVENAGLDITGKRGTVTEIQSHGLVSVSIDGGGDVSVWPENLKVVSGPAAAAAAAAAAAGASAQIRVDAVRSHRAAAAAAIPGFAQILADATATAGGIDAVDGMLAQCKAFEDQSLEMHRGGSSAADCLAWLDAKLLSMQLEPDASAVWQAFNSMVEDRKAPIDVVYLEHPTIPGCFAAVVAKGVSFEAIQQEFKSSLELSVDKVQYHVNGTRHVAFDSAGLELIFAAAAKEGKTSCTLRPFDVAATLIGHVEPID